MSLRLRVGNNWVTVGSLSQESKTSFNIGPRRTSPNTGFLDAVNESNLKDIELNIPLGGSIDYLFSNCRNLKHIPDKELIRASSCRNMFSYCTGLIDVGYLNLSNSNDMQYMFSDCTSLTKIEGIDASNTNSLAYMFRDATQLLDVTLYNLDNIYNVDRMFSGATRVNSLRLHNLGVRESSTTARRRLDVSKTALTSIGLDDLVASLGYTGGLTNPWILITKRGVIYNTSAATDKGWVLDTA